MRERGSWLVTMAAFQDPSLPRPYMSEFVVMLLPRSGGLTMIGDAVGCREVGA
jgi:hypothetical protein